MSGNRFADAGEEMLEQMRKMNAANALRAMADLQRGDQQRGSLPPVRSHRIKVLQPDQPSRSRKRIRPRSETPKEIRGAAEREMIDSEKASRRPLRESMHAYSPHSEMGSTVVRKLFATTSSEEEGPYSDAKEEQILLLQLLDLQSQSRNRSPAIRDFFSGIKGPEALFEQEVEATARFLKMHNLLIREYLNLSKFAARDEGPAAEEGTATRVAPLPTAVPPTEDAAAATPEAPVQIVSASPSETGRGRRRKRKEGELKELLNDAYTLRQRALRIVGSGGMQLAKSPGDTAQGAWGGDEEVENRLRPIGRSTLLVLNMMLRGAISDEHPTVFGRGGGGTAADSSMQEVAHMRQMLEEMRRRALSEAPALRAASAKRRRVMDELRRRRAWEERVQAQSSLSSVGSLDESSLSESELKDPRGRRAAGASDAGADPGGRRRLARRRGRRGADRAAKATMRVLQRSGGWLGAGGGLQGGEMGMEARLRQLRERNQRLYEAAWTDLSLPARAPRRREDDGGLAPEATAEGEDRAKRRRRRRRPLGMAAGGPYGGPGGTVYTWSAEDGYRAEGEHSGWSEGGEDSLNDEDGRDGQQPAAGAAASRAAAGEIKVKARTVDRGKIRAAVAASAASGPQRTRTAKEDAAEVRWLDDLLPSATDVSEDEDAASEAGLGGTSPAADTDFWASPAVRQVAASLAKVQTEQRSKQGELVRQSVQLQQLQTQAGRAHASADNIAAVQERVMHQVARIRREITSNVRSIFQRVGDARRRIAKAQELEDFDLARSMTQDAQRTLVEAEADTVALRQRIQRQQSINLDLMPEYLKEFVLLSTPAQALFDKARLAALQEKAHREDELERRGEEAYERELKRRGQELFQDTDELNPEEAELLEEMLADSRELIILLRTSYKKSQDAQAAGDDAVQAAGHAESATVALERAILLAKMIRKKMRRPKARRLRKFYPPHLRNLKEGLTVSLFDLWKTGKIVPEVCDAIPALQAINEKILEAKKILIKLDEGDALTATEETTARNLLEESILQAVEVRERARASMLDYELGGEEVYIWQFPRHLQNLIATDESVIVLWEKGLTEEQICEWVHELENISDLIRTSLRMDQKAAEAGMSPETLELLATVDKMQFEADKRFEALRRGIRIAIRKGFMLVRLPPHLQNVVMDGRRLMTLFKEGRIDAVQALLIHHAVLLMRRHGIADEAKKRAQRLMDEENKRQAFIGAEAESLSALKEMLRMRAKFILAGLDPDAKVPQELQDAMDVAEGMAGTTLSAEVLAELGQEMGASADLLVRVARFQRMKVVKEKVFETFDWSTLVGFCASNMEPPSLWEPPSHLEGRSVLDPHRTLATYSNLDPHSTLAPHSNLEPRSELDPRSNLNFQSKLDAHGTLQPRASLAHRAPGWCGFDATPVFKQLPEHGLFSRKEATLIAGSDLLLSINEESVPGDRDEASDILRHDGMSKPAQDPSVAVPSSESAKGGIEPDETAVLMGLPVDDSFPLAMDGNPWLIIDPVWCLSASVPDDVKPGWSILPVFDDPHPISADSSLFHGDGGIFDEGEKEQGTGDVDWEPTQAQKVVASDEARLDDSDEDEASRLGRRKAVKVNAKTRLQGNTQVKKGIALDTRKNILDIVAESKRTLAIDVSNMELPYLPKQVYDSVHINSLIADHNLLDYIDPALGRMFNLKLLSLSWNRIEAPFPDNFWHLVNLRTLNLDHNQIDEIPKQVYLLSSLTRFRLDANNLSVIPPELGIRTNLKFLTLERNFLKELPIEMKKLAKLLSLTLGRNEFTHFPDCIFSLGSLKLLHIDHNQIPAFPPQLSNLKSLTDLNLGANLITELPASLSAIVTLRKFDVSRNEIRALGFEVGHLTALIELNLGHNHLTQIPEVVDRLVILKRLKVNSNRLTYLPQDLTQLTVLELLDIRHNLFIALAPQLGRVTTLTEITVLGNPMRTPAPFVCDAGTEIMLQYLQRLDAAIASGEMDLHDLRIPRRKILIEKGDVISPRYGKKKKDKFKIMPEIICPLREFHFPHGWYTGQFGLKRENIISLDLSGNGMRFLLGPEFSGNKEKCVVPHGMVDGKAPPDGWMLDPLSRLEKLQLQDNRLPELPAEFEYLTALQYLDLRNNVLERLSGPHFGQLVNLTYLNLRNNVKLRRLPFEMGKFDKLTWLDVIDCTITSPPPVIIQRGVKPIVDYLRRHFDSTFSKALDLDGLLLMSIPHDVTEGFFLTAAYLRNNAISLIPQTIGEMQELRILRLDFNRLSTLPETMTKLRNLTELGLSNNLLTEVFPTSEMFLAFTGLKHLDASHNVITSIPPTLCELKDFSILRLNHNRLKTVPFEMYRLTNLTVLDLRCNVLRLPLKDIAEDEDIGCLLELLRTFVNARGDPHPKYLIQPSNWLDLSDRPYKLLLEEVVSITNLVVLKLACYQMENMTPYISSLGKLKILELHENRLNSLPDSMLILTELVRLSLSRNLFPRMPYCLSTLTNLKSLHLDDNLLTVIFADIKSLVSLTELDLSRNSLRQVTTNIQFLTALRMLDLSSNQLSYLPKEFSLLTCIERLSLRDNFITELPTELHVLSEGKLEVFEIEDNGLKSPPPEIVKRGNDAIFQYLRVFDEARFSGMLDLSDMGLTYLPGEVMRFYRTEGVECHGLQSLVLDGNDIGWLPTYLRSMTTLTRISLKRCRFTRLPYFLGDLRALTALDVEGNDVVVPSAEVLRRGVEAIKAYMRNLDQAWWTKELDMSAQRWESVPVEICDVDSLTCLRLQNQPLGSIPPEIGRVSALTHLNLQNCGLVELPDSVGGLFNLRELLVNNNRLVTLPRGIGACTALTALRAHENMLEALPPEVGNLRQMLDLRLFNNNLLTLPAEIGHMRYLPAFRISANQLPAITAGVGGLEAVRDLLIADNLLEFLPREIGLLTAITRLRATNNRLRSLPAELRNLQCMTELAVSSNRLTELPLIGVLTALRNLIVAENPLRMPPEPVLRRGTFAVVNYLRVLEEADGAPVEVVTRGEDALAAFHDIITAGRATGEMSLRARVLLAVPQAVLDCGAALTTLDMGVNLLEDLPPAVGGLASLTDARLGYNQLRSLPPELAALTSLTRLDLRYNFLTALPECVCALPALHTLLADSNEIQELPAAAAGLTSLVELSLANNSLRRVNPAAPAGLGALATLRLQQNELFMLPDSVGLLTGLTRVDLSFNHLSQLPPAAAGLTGVTDLRLDYNELRAGAALPVETMAGLTELHLAANRLPGLPHTLARLTRLRVLTIGGNDFPLEPQQQRLLTWETAQHWLRANLDAWAAAQALKAKQAPALRRGGRKG